MKRKATDIQKTKLALTIVSITERLVVVVGGIALIALGYSLWGIACIVLSMVTLAADGMLVKRPMLVDEYRVLVGFNTPE
jgi:hypothetical protein